MPPLSTRRQLIPLSDLQILWLDWSLSDLEETIYTDSVQEKHDAYTCMHRCKNTSFTLYNLGLGRFGHIPLYIQLPTNRQRATNRHMYTNAQTYTKIWLTNTQTDLSAITFSPSTSFSIYLCPCFWTLGRHILFHLSVWMETDMFKTHNNGRTSTKEALCFVCLKHCIIS